MSTLLLGLLVCAVATDEAGRHFLESNGMRDEVNILDSGLQYEIIVRGDEGERPSRNSPCQCHYRGTLLDGTEFDSSYKRGRPATFAPNQVIKGWTEALQLMTPGSKWKLYIPSELAYGDRGAGNIIPGGAVLIFELELISFDAGSTDVGQYMFWGLCGLGFIFVVFMLYILANEGDPIKDLPRIPLDAARSMPGNSRVFFDLEADGEFVGRVEFVLFNSLVPKTAENFLQLCTGDNPKKLCYKGSPFHRVIPSFMCQGGDITSGDGRGGESIYGATFADEFTSRGVVPHDEPLLLSMANKGPNTNGSQFFITTASTRWLDGKHVVFGCVASGAEVVGTIEELGSRDGRTSKKVIVNNCGEVSKKAN